MSRSEKAILNDTLVQVSALPETICWRNNTGTAWAGRRVDARIGQTIVVKPGMTIIMNAQPVSFGLPGSADIMGASAGRPVAIETKTAIGRQSDLQVNFEAAWTKAGGLYILARSPEDALTALDRTDPLLG